MVTTAISVRGLGKCYQLGETLSHDLLSARLGEGIKRLLGRRSGPTSPRGPQSFWALKDICFDVREGEVLGVIGRNGAGKSTLLKILSRITEPTAGEIRIRGRVASLLEVGTGFHKELTGRENVQLNGAILGMSRTEIRAKFDDIVQFAGVEKFIDTPVKRYSSGMTVRLAFAVAAHLEPEILMIDEVLAVGDAEFQKRCLGKMGEVAKAGRTILFVSHNLAAVEALCDRVALLQSGELVGLGPTNQMIADYLAAVEDTQMGESRLDNHPGRPRSARPLMTRVSLSGITGGIASSFSIHDDLRIRVEFESPEHAFTPVLGYVVKDQLGAPLFSLDNRTLPGFSFPPSRGGVIYCEIPALPLMPGRYSLDLYLGDHSRSLDSVTDAVSFTVLEKDVFGTGRLPHAHAGSIIWSGRWRYEARESA